jgi:hypothetical protein
MSNVRATSSIVREPWRTSLLAAGAAGLGGAVGRCVGGGVGFAVGRWVGGAVDPADGVVFATGVGVGDPGAVGAVAEPDGLQSGEHAVVGASVGTDALRDAAGATEPGAADPQLATTSAAARDTVRTERWTSEDRCVI